MGAVGFEPTQHKAPVLQTGRLSNVDRTPGSLFLADVRLELTARKLRYDNLPGGSEGT